MGRSFKVCLVPRRVAVTCNPVNRSGPHLAVGCWDRRLCVYAANGQLQAEARVGFEPCSIALGSGPWAGTTCYQQRLASLTLPMMF